MGEDDVVADSDGTRRRGIDDMQHDRPLRQVPRDGPTFESRASTWASGYGWVKELGSTVAVPLPSRLFDSIDSRIK
jgi:hypothetical protein